MQRLTRTELLERATWIAQEYAGNLTLRQLYYQLVARGFSPNSQQDYKRIGDVVAKARMARQFPLDWLVDRGRTVHEGRNDQCWLDVDEALTDSAGELRNMPNRHLFTSRWWNQPRHVSVWVEKEALAGVFQAPCQALGVSWFACKGYPSISALYQWVQQVKTSCQIREDRGATEIDEVVILYFGDHDPDGWQIPRSALSTVLDLQHVADDCVLPPVRLQRCALNMDQIEEHDPVPFPAKLTSSRYASYVDEHGTTSAWELDALPPRVLSQLVRDEVSALFDDTIAGENDRAVAAARYTMTERMDLEWVRGALEGK